jgi:hypothetical protein
MELNAKNYRPLRFVDKMEGGNHLMLFYDKPEFGKGVQYRFVENGLKKGEHCICLTHDNVGLVENEIASCGIDVDGFKEKNLLHVHQIENLLESEKEIEKGFDNIIKQVTADAKPPYRFVGRIIPDVSTVKGIESELLVERKLHSQFDNYDCSFLCTYNVEDIEPHKRQIWLGQLMKNHHNLIYATEPDKAVVFEPQLLRPIAD